MSYQAISATTIIHGATTVDCQKQVRSWRLLRSFMEYLIPSCNCTSFEQQEDKEESYFNKKNRPKPSYTSSTIMTCTIFSYRKGKVNFCIQANSKNSTPFLLLDLQVPATILATEMQGGRLRIALQCIKQENGSISCSLLSTPLWTMYCNGRKVGYAVKRIPSKDDIGALELMSSVDEGAGIINGKELDHCDQDELTYLRAKFESVCGSTDSQSFHLVDPDGKIGQELSIFFFRSR